MAYQLVQEHISDDTIEALEAMLASAKKGQIVGIAFALMLRRQRYMVDCAGDACSNPFLARAGVAVLDDHISNMIHHRRDAGTTF